jgi:hypothetical protein
VGEHGEEAGRVLLRNQGINTLAEAMLNISEQLKLLVLYVTSADPQHHEVSRKYQHIDETGRDGTTRGPFLLIFRTFQKTEF